MKTFIISIQSILLWCFITHELKLSEAIFVIGMSIILFTFMVIFFKEKPKKVE